MAIQTVNLAVPNGDTPRSANTKINANFTDQDNAASRLLGATKDRIPLAQDVFTAMYGAVHDPVQTYAGSANDLAVGTRIYALSGVTDLPADTMPCIISTFNRIAGRKTQILESAIADGPNIGILSRQEKNGTNTWTEWAPLGSHALTYSTTTASGANVVVTTTGVLQRSTSSERYKDILAPLELDDARYADAMALKPIIYRSTADADNPLHHYYSFSAEELGAYDPAFTLWRTTEMVTDADGNTTEQPLAERQAEGININALLAMSHAIAIKQDKIIKALETRIEILEAK